MSNLSAICDAAARIRVSVLLCHAALLDVADGKTIKRRHQEQLFHACMDVVETVEGIEMMGRHESSLHEILDAVQLLDQVADRLPTRAERDSARSASAKTWTAYSRIWMGPQDLTGEAS